MLAEGDGYLLIEDFSPADPAARSNIAPQNELFTLAAGDGPSKTLIEWKQSMWYDFSILQTRFEGQVSLKHFSGLALERIFGAPQGANANRGANPGRATYLNCDMLTTDFSGRDGAPSTSDGRMGRLSANDLKSFRAAGNVKLQDETEGLTLEDTTDLIYERDRSILFIQGTPARKASAVIQKGTNYPTPFSAERIIYNLKSKSFEVYRPDVSGR